ncbi:MAG: FecR domain-containing protein [Prevotella sp.]|nr:FecR domain-containing protein [Prevotella sp.]
MTTKDDYHKNTEEQLLEQLVDIMDEGHELTDDEMARLAGNEEAIRAYRQMAALKHVVGTPEPESSAPSEHLNANGVESAAPSEHESASPSGRLFNVHALPALLAIAAAILALVIFTHPWSTTITETAEGSGSLMAYEHTEKPDGIILKTSEERPIDLTAKRSRVTRARLTNNKGQLVLDYQTSSGNSYSISHPVQTDTIDVPCGNDFKLILADGTEVWLYADSRLIYPAQFVGDERRVFLEGEAYFRVTKDADHPFIVSTDRMEARVLGTELNVNSRENHVALINGSVEVKGIGIDGVQRLIPGQGASLIDGRRLLVEQENMDTYVYWRNGYIFFDDNSVRDIAQQLGRWFNVSVEISSERLAAMRLHFLYKRSDSMKRILALLNSFGEFNAVIKNNTLVIRE